MWTVFSDVEFFVGPADHIGGAGSQAYRKIGNTIISAFPQYSLSYFSVAVRHF